MMKLRVMVPPGQQGTVIEIAEDGDYTLSVRITCAT